MSKACSNLYMPFDHSLKGPDHASKEALTYALLETVRLVLEGHKSDDEEKADALAPPDHVTSSEHTSSDHYVDAPSAPPPKKVSPKAGVLGGPCAHCGAAESPQWRRPLTKKVVLCNACGIYYSRHHSLPKRKKMPGVKHSAGEDMEVKEEESSGPPPRASTPKPEADHMAVCEPAPFKPDTSANSDGCFGLGLKPLMTQRESISSAECMQYAAEAEPKPAQVHTPTNSVSMACMSPSTSCGSPMHFSSGIAAPPTTPKKRTDDQIDALFDAHEESLAKRAMKRAAAAAMTAAAGHAAAAAMSAATANSTGTSSPAGEMSEGFMAGGGGGGGGGGMRRPLITASLAASMGRQMPSSMQHQLSPSPLQMPQRVSILEALMHQAHSHSRMGNNPLGSTVHAFASLPGILMTTGNASFHAQAPPGYKPVGPSLSEQSADSDGGSIMMPATTCRGPRSKPASRQGSPVYSKYRA